MKQVQIIIADSNEDFAVQIQNRIESVMGHTVNVVLITDREYLLDYFETPRNPDVLIIDQNLYFRGLERHNIEWIYVVTEDSGLEESSNETFLRYIYRFSPLKTIVDKALSGLSENEWREVPGQGKCKMILVTSPSGGCGKTTTAMALGTALRKRGKKVLFVDTTNMQISSCFLKDRKKGKDDGFIQDNLIPGDVKNIIEHGIFDYVSPFNQPLPVLSVAMQDYLDVLQFLIKEGSYDYIIVDTVSDFTIETAQLMDLAHIVLVISLQDSFSVAKLKKFFASVDCSDSEKFRIICSMFRAERKNLLLDAVQRDHVIQYIPFANFGETFDLKTLGEMQCYKSLAAMFI